MAHNNPLVWIGLAGISPDDNPRAVAWEKRLHWVMVAIAMLALPAYMFDTADPQSSWHRVASRPRRGHFRRLPGRVDLDAAPYQPSRPVPGGELAQRYHPARLARERAWRHLQLDRAGASAPGSGGWDGAGADADSVPRAIHAARRANAGGRGIRGHAVLGSDAVLARADDQQLLGRPVARVRHGYDDRLRRRGAHHRRLASLRRVHRADRGLPDGALHCQHRCLLRRRRGDATAQGAAARSSSGFTNRSAG